MLAQARPAPRALVMDCLPNMQQDVPASVHNDTLNVLAQLRKGFPDTEILVLEGHRYTTRWIKPEQRKQELALCAAQKSAVEKVIAMTGDSKLHYASGEGKLGKDEAVAAESTGGMGCTRRPSRTFTSRSSWQNSLERSLSRILNELHNLPSKSGRRGILLYLVLAYSSYS